MNAFEESIHRLAIEAKFGFTREEIEALGYEMIDVSKISCEGCALERIRVCDLVKYHEALEVAPYKPCNSDYYTVVADPKGLGMEPVLAAYDSKIREFNRKRQEVIDATEAEKNIEKVHE